MAQQRLPMRKIRDVLRLKAVGMSKRKIAAALGIGATAAGECLRRAREAGVGWPLPDDMTDAGLEARLYPASTVLAEIKARRPQPDWPAIHRELKRKGVTLQLVWEEHRAGHAQGYGYSRFCELYRAWEGRLSPTMRQTHVGGEKLFVDYAGTTMEVIDGATGEAIKVQLFVAVLGASSHTWAEATWTQTLPDWIGSHTRAFAFFGGVAAMVVSDNLKAGITKACFYEPSVNRSYAEMAAHYDTAIVPARPYKPRDKAKVEVGVQVATRWIIAKLRKRQFFSLAELNAAIAVEVAALNARVTRHLGASRKALFEELERPALKALPAEPYVYAEWKQCRLGLDYHVEVEKHYYSAPHQLLREKVWVRITARTVEVFHCGKRVAAHVRSSSNRRHTTVREHMPSSHRRYADWTLESLRRARLRSGAAPRRWSRSSCAERTHPEQGFRSCVGILRLATPHGAGRLEAACARALQIGARSYTSVNSILKNNLDRKRPEPATDGPAISTATSVAQATSIEENTIDADTPDHRSAASAQARRHGRRICRAGDPRPIEGAVARRMAGAAGRPRGGQPLDQPLAQPPQGCPAQARPSLASRTSTTARNAASTRRCTRASPPAAGSPSIAPCSSPGPAASASRGSLARWRRRPAATATACITPACRACSPISSWRTAMAASPDCSARSPRLTC